ncbi:ww domain-containing [Pyrenophora seminiperda CCB06]|uniref:Ww domain-containing n=1 Tax=Pyrenophora seminiperda CCB06 TaxID=1302712 RepID=A0A3M7M102_9PLEO|nr:ww domain-containing [Pyrenophora seminiperda CCB06]
MATSALGMASPRGELVEARKPSPTAGASSPSEERPRTPQTDRPAHVKTVNREGSYGSSTEAPLPYDDAPPLPDEPVPDAQDDGWTHRVDPTSGCYYYVNTRTGVSQWENPRVPEATVYPYASAYSYNTHGSEYNSTSYGSVPGVASSSGAPGTSSPAAKVRKWGGYNPRIHGSYDPNADYAKEAAKEEEEIETAANPAATVTSTGNYATTAQFNRFNGKYQQAGQGPEIHNDENKSHRQMAAFFDVNAAANSHDGRSLKAERRSRVPTKEEVKAHNAKRHAKKEAKRKEWLLS